MQIVSEREISLSQRPANAVQTCVRALTAAGYHAINVDSASSIVTAEKRGGMRTTDQATITIDGSGPYAHVRVLVQAEAMTLQEQKQWLLAYIRHRPEADLTVADLRVNALLEAIQAL